MKLIKKKMKIKNKGLIGLFVVVDLDLFFSMPTVKLGADDLL